MGSFLWLLDLWSSPTAAIFKAAGAALSAIFVAWKFAAERSDKRSDTRAEALDRLEAGLRKEQMELFQGVRAELTETKKALSHWQALARYWYEAARDLLRQYKDLRRDAETMERWIGAAIARVPGLREPDMDGVPEHSPSLPMGIEDPILRRGEV